MRIVATGATLSDCPMLKNEGALLLLMALEALLVRTFQRGYFILRAVRVMAVGATNSAFRNGMVILQFKLNLLVQMALETCLGVILRVDYLGLVSSTFHM